jgi:hypothetical protein
MTDVEAVVPPSSAIDCIARLGGSARSQCLVKLGPAPSRRPRPARADRLRLYQSRAPGAASTAGSTVLYGAGTVEFVSGLPSRHFTS